MTSIKLQDQVYVATIKRQDSDVDIVHNANRQTPDITPTRTPPTRTPIRSKSPVFDDVSIARPQRPRLDLRYSNNNITNLHSIDDRFDEIPSQMVKEQQIMTSSNPPKNKWRIYAIYLWQITGGFSDSTPGALLPYIESDYDLTYTVVSLIWMSNAVGFIFIACLSHKIQSKLGKFKSLIMGTFSSVIMYAIVSSGTAFPAIVVAFFFGGCGLATVLAQANVFLARLDKSSKYLSLCHGSYGLGATIAPLISTSMATAGIPWHYFYLILLGMMMVNTLIFSFAFSGSDHDLAPWDHDDELEGLLQHGHETPVEEQGVGLSDLGNNSTVSDVNSGQSTPKKKKLNQRSNDTSTFIESVKLPTTWIAAFFVLFYQGAEVSLAGWIVTFLLDYRHGPSSVGYVASGFWGGLTVGRLFVARPMHKWFGARRSVLVVSLISILLVVLTWVIPHVIVSGIIVSIAGVFVGPNYPLMISVVADLLPRKVQVTSLTLITAAGSSGGALFPFLVGLLSQEVGAFVVLPAFIILYASMTILWLCLPNKERMAKGETNLTVWQKIW